MSLQRRIWVNFPCHFWRIPFWAQAILHKLAARGIFCEPFNAAWVIEAAVSGRNGIFLAV
jgi:hypothetical protein